MTDLKKVDIANFIFIWIILGIACVIPFELFLFSYAVLGPLHYLTEINWLEKKNYFLNKQTDKRTYLVAVTVLMVVVSLGFLLTELGHWDVSRPVQNLLLGSAAAKPAIFLMNWGYTALFIALILTIVYQFTANQLNRILLISISVILTVLFFRYPAFVIWVGLFLPTVIHVFFFTLIFMLAGARRSKSLWGYLNVLSVALILIIISNLNVTLNAGSVSKSAYNALVSSDFYKLNFYINEMLGLSEGSQWSYYSLNVWRVQVFIAFAYTYHYINWFSKTSVINWHQVDRKKMILAVVLWLVSIALFYFNYRVGLVALSVLSILHVILEFPLNVTSISGLVKRTPK